LGAQLDSLLSQVLFFQILFFYHATPVYPYPGQGSSQQCGHYGQDNDNGFEIFFHN